MKVVNGILCVPENAGCRSLVVSRMPRGTKMSTPIIDMVAWYVALIWYTGVVYAHIVRSGRTNTPMGR